MGNPRLLHKPMDLDGRNGHAEPQQPLAASDTQGAQPLPHIEILTVAGSHGLELQEFI
jgi:hypothetical protein